MQKLITKYGLAAHLAFLAVAPLFLSSIDVLWLSLLGLTWLLMEPSKIGGEMLHDARRRVCGVASRDPLFWVLLAVVIFACARWLNAGVAMAYDAETGEWFLKGAAVSWFPGSAENSGAQEFAASVVLLVVVLGCRHALGKSARQAFLVLVSILIGVFGLVLSFLHYDGSALVRSLAVFELRAPVHIGMVFGFGLLTTTVAMISAFERVWRVSIFLLLLAMAGSVAGLLVFSPVWTVAAFGAAGVLLFLFSFVYAKLTMSGSNEFKFIVAFSLGLVLAGVVAVGVVTEKPLLEKFESLQNRTLFTREYSSARSALSDVSRRAWQGHPWIGAGVGAFAHVVRFSATEEDWTTIPPDQAYALNGYWHFLVERGLVGALVALCPLALLLFSYFRRLVVGVRCHLPSPSSWVGLVALSVVLALMLADCAVFYPGVGTLTAAILAISANSFPKEKVHV